MATYVYYQRNESRYIVTDDWSQCRYPCTQRRLNEALRSQKIGLTVKSKRSPRVAELIRPNGKKIETDRHWALDSDLQDAAEIIHTLQQLDRGGKTKYYKELGL